MTSRDFVFWLQGYFEILDPANVGTSDLPLSSAQAACIRRHLALVFKHEINPPVPKQELLGKAGTSGLWDLTQATYC